MPVHARFQRMINQTQTFDPIIFSFFCPATVEVRIPPEWQSDCLRFIGQHCRNVFRLRLWGVRQVWVGEPNLAKQVGFKHAMIARLAKLKTATRPGLLLRPSMGKSWYCRHLQTFSVADAVTVPHAFSPGSWLTSSPWWFLCPAGVSARS